MRTLDQFKCHDLGGGHVFWVGTLPDELVFDDETFEEVWRMHPEEFHIINMRGVPVKTPRWQQAYGVDYYYTGRVNKALPTPPVLAPLLAWSKEAIDPRLTGLLLNWYDGAEGHYIGKHRDSTENMIEGTPIVTISFGEERIFRIRPYDMARRLEKIDFPARNGLVFVMPYETNQAFTHEVPKSAAQGRRISVTVRGLYSLDGPIISCA